MSFIDAQCRLKLRKGQLYRQTTRSQSNGGIGLYVLKIIPIRIADPTDEDYTNKEPVSGIEQKIFVKTMHINQTITYVGMSHDVVVDGKLLPLSYPMFIDNQNGKLVTVHALVTAKPGKYLRVLKY